MGKELLGYKGAKPVFLLVALCTVAQSLAIILQAKWLAEVISALFAGSSPYQQAGEIGWFLLAFLARHVISMLQQRLAQRFAEETGSDLRQRLLAALFQRGPAAVRTEGTGNVVTLVLDGIGKFRKYAELVIPRMLGVGITPILVWLYVFATDRISGLILLVTMPILIAFLILVGLAARKQTEKQLGSYRVLSNHFVDSLRGLETLKYLGQSAGHSRSIKQVSEGYRKATMRTLRVAFLSSFSLDFFTMLSVATVAVNLGLRLINGSLELLPALTVLVLAPEYFLPVRMLGADFHATLDGRQAGLAMQSMIREAEAESGATPLPDTKQPAAGEQKRPPQAQGPQRYAIGNANGGSSGLPRKAGKGPAAPPIGKSFAWETDSLLRLTGIGKRYEDGGRASLEGIDLQIRGRRKVGIVGESGAGKSTLIDLLGGFVPASEGTISLDGVPMSDADRRAWREQITYMPQHPYLFSCSLEDNVKFYAPDASRAEVVQAVETAGLSKLVASLPQGLDEHIGGGGRALSGGQAQRVALARALLGNRPVLLLDEPTAHLDIETEYELKETMLPLFRDKWVFLATHRLHWMPHMDYIIVLDAGRVAETGTHGELMARRGVYYQLITSQMEGVL